MSRPLKWITPLLVSQIVYTGAVVFAADEYADRWGLIDDYYGHFVVRAQDPESPQQPLDLGGDFPSDRSRSW